MSITTIVFLLAIAGILGCVLCGVDHAKMKNGYLAARWLVLWIGEHLLPIMTIVATVSGLILIHRRINARYPNYLDNIRVRAAIGLVCGIILIYSLYLVPQYFPSFMPNMNVFWAKWQEITDPAIAVNAANCLTRHHGTPNDPLMPIEKFVATLVAAMLLALASACYSIYRLIVG